MTATIHAELTSDGERLVLIGVGSDIELAGATRGLGLLTPLVQPTVPAGGMTLPVSWPAVVQLAATFGAHWRPGPGLLAWMTEQVRSRVSAPIAEPTVNAAGYTPRVYQLEGAAIIAATGRTLIFDEMGSGKSATTVLGLVQRAAAGHPVWPALVIAPASVVDPWLEQFRIWAPQLRVVAWRGAPALRAELVGTADAYVTSYETCRIDTIGGIRPSAKHNPLLRLKPVSVVVDESHRIKNNAAKQTRAVKKHALNANVFVALSGTPITHHPADLWPALDALAPGAWPSRERWIGRYCTTLQGDYGDTILGLARHHEEEFRRAIVGQHRRVAKADVLAQLPPKVYSIRSVELPAEHRRAYDDMEANMIAEMPGLDGEPGDEMSVMGVLAQLTRLSQLACASADVAVETEIVDDPLTGQPVEKTHQRVTLRAPSWKVDALLEVLAERPGKPTIATAPSRQLMMLAGTAAREAGLSVGYVVGGQSSQDRTETIARFQAGELDLICVTTGAGGVGITLTAADTIVFLQRPWSFVESEQMESRCHRIGSEIHESVHIIDIVAKNTIDTRFRAVLRERAGQLADLVRDPRIVEQLLGGDNVRRISGKKAA